ncbi:glycosyl hydrolase family 18 protein [Thermoactinomyces sp. CICC 10523]|uniref:glycosyl hydrolase family 18 protein n=1 Tax=Thermoactinomyces sp. CICC 10523 TaxID=2767428 RepID=UPI0018DBF395|nr:glycosyl hydrolase family 18 protein [Thermoactinomyces sp. CICC 10523]MBH8598098.1 spore gernimation protein [Thermoactinomyces sp. CICC 10523]
MKRILLLFTVLTLIFTGCSAPTKKESGGKRPQATAYRTNHTEPMNTRGRTVPVKPREKTKPPAAKPHIDTIGFLEVVDPKTAVAAVNQAAPNLTYVSFFSYRVRSDGSLIPLNDTAPLLTTRKNGAVPMLVITNFANGNFQSDIAHRIFTNKAASRKLIANVIRVMKQKGYRALNVDFEHLHPQDRHLYNDFLATLVPLAKREGFIVSTALAPKQSDHDRGPWHGAHDYAFHGKIADFVILMTYEWGWTGGPPMAVSPVPQIRKVIEYAKTKIPARKIIMGAPLYGYDWTLPYKKGGPPAKRISPKEADTLAHQKGIKVRYSKRDEAPWFRYTDRAGKRHEVWFEDAQSIQAKFNLVKQYRLHGISYWVLGESFPENWTMLRDNFHINKF